jgi:hypothetical protein
VVSWTLGFLLLGYSNIPVFMGVGVAGVYRAFHFHIWRTSKQLYLALFTSIPNLVFHIWQAHQQENKVHPFKETSLAPRTIGV